MTVEQFEGRVLFAFNAYIAGLASGAKDVSSSFVFSTTGQAAKSWLIDWGDNSTTPLTAPDPGVGFTTPQTQSHTYVDFGTYTVTATATSITNVTATAVPLGENSAFGNGGGTGKEVQVLSDGGSVGTNIDSVVDDDNNTYVLTVDGKRMAVTRFKPDGTLDTTSAWKSTGTYVADPITLTTTQDTPKAIAIDRTNHYLFLVGTSGTKWGAIRINYDYINTTPEGWHWADLTGTASDVWLDTTDRDRIGIVGNNSSNQIQMAMLWSADVAGFGGHTGGTLVTSFNSPNGYAAAPNSIYGVPSPYVVTASASAVFEGDDAGVGGEEWFVSGTVGYCCASSTPSIGSDMVIVDFLQDGTLKGTGWGNGNGSTILYNTCNGCGAVGYSMDSAYAMVPTYSSDTITLAGSNGSNVLLERFDASTGLKDTDFGPFLSGSTTGGKLKVTRTVI